LKLKKDKNGLYGNRKKVPSATYSNGQGNMG